MQLSEIKTFLRMDESYTEEDTLLESLQTSAIQYAQNATGKQYESDNELYNLLLKILIAHWYENREIVQEGTKIEIPHSITAIMHHIAMCGKYHSVGVEDG